MSKLKGSLFVVLVVLSNLALVAGCSQPTNESAATQIEELDLVLAGARVMNPEDGFDAIANVGIRDGKIVAISEQSLSDALSADGQEVDVAGKVLAPGFIDLHSHGMSDVAWSYRARDGVTTTLEMEWGYPRLAAWFAAKEGKSLLNYGATVAHGMARGLAIAPDGREVEEWRDSIEAEFTAAAEQPDPLRAFQGTIAQTFPLSLSSGDYDFLFAELERGLEEGALGIGMAHAYYPGATREEIFEVFEFAAGKDVPIYTHVRSMGVEPHQEVIANAAATGASLHIVHINSTSLGSLPTVLAMVEGAQQRGLDVTAEAYPYTAGSTGLQSALFDPGWQEQLGISYGDLQWVETGERLNRETFERYREQGGTVILHMMEEEWIDQAMNTDFVMIASDAMPYEPLAHPRSAGTYARILGRYVRERKAIDMMTALRKMTLMPAQRLEGVAPQMKNKGRVAVGADADLVVFDPETVIDRATFEEGLEFSDGIEHVLVSGTFVVRNGENVPDVYPGRPIKGRYSQ